MIQRKKKRCKICKEERYLFSKGCCGPCWNKAFGKPVLSSKVVKKISDKHKLRLEKYKVLRDEFLKDKTCQFPGCSSKETECHHASGRSGDNLFKDFRALCRKHHMFVEANPLEARELGLSNTRLN